MRFELLHPADQLIMIMNRIYYRGMTTTSGGNLSIRDENGDVWITPSGIDKGMLTRDDIMLIKADGAITGRHKPSSEYPFHLAVYQNRPDIRAVLHAHSPGLVAFSILRKLPDIHLIPTIKTISDDQISVAKYAVPGSRALGESIAGEFAGGHSVVLLENHGIVIGESDIFQAFMTFETLESAALLHINARKIGAPRPLSEEELEMSREKDGVSLPEFTPLHHSSEENAARRDLIKLIRRSYEQGLFTSTQGTYSARLRDGAFVITPFGRDRMYLEAEDLVLIRDGKGEAGKAPSRAVALHEAIYRRHPDIQSVLIAHPPNIMAFAVTDVPFDPRTIPESYILLREIKKLPFGVSFLDPEAAAAAFSPKTPAVICENDCIIVTGSSLLNAFDRLEVAEFTAKSIIASKSVGDIIHISDSQVAQINAAFNLPE